MKQQPLQSIQLLLTQPVIQQMEGDDSKNKENNFKTKTQVLDVISKFYIYGNIWDKNSNPAVLLIIVIQIEAKG